MRFTLVIRPDGKGILTCKERLTEEQFGRVRDVWDKWKEEEGKILIAMETDVVVVNDIELDIET